MQLHYRRIQHFPAYPICRSFTWGQQILKFTHFRIICWSLLFFNFYCIYLLHWPYRRMQFHEVPSDILKLQQLRILDLSQNSLQSISEVKKYIYVIKKTHGLILSLLDIYSQFIISAPDEVFSLTCSFWHTNCHWILDNFLIFACRGSETLLLSLSLICQTITFLHSPQSWSVEQR